MCVCVCVRARACVRVCVRESERERERSGRVYRERRDREKWPLLARAAEKVTADDEDDRERTEG